MELILEKARGLSRRRTGRWVWVVWYGGRYSLRLAYGRRAVGKRIVALVSGDEVTTF